MSLHEKIEFLIQNGAMLQDTRKVYLYHPKISQNVFLLRKDEFEKKGICKKSRSACGLYCL